ncbi:MAG: hypothetical protein JJ934_01015 [Pseudomonadales bacterium]|nr:hypothetical protein [Pseudomonadales bacterium]
MREFERMTVAEVIDAQRAWTNAVIDQDVEALLALYDFGSREEPLLFKPTLTDEIRLDEEGARSYFVGGNPKYPHDHGFLFNAWKRIEFRSAAGPLIDAGGLGYRDMGQYTFFNENGEMTHADYTYAYHKLRGKVLISLHHSSLTWRPEDEG